jgi:uncharacterized protein (TIGR03435 family)
MLWSQLVNHLWQSTAFAAALGVLTLTMRENKARVRYWLWMSASLKFLLPFVLLVSLGSHLAQPRPIASEQSVQNISALYAAVNQIGQPATPYQPIASVHTASMQIAHSFSLRSILPELLGAIWLCGVLGVLGMWSVRWLRVKRIVHAAKPMYEGREVEALRRLARIVIGVRTPITIRLSQSSLEPGVFGMRRPVLLWPAGISERLNQAQLDAVLAHEVWHVRHRDNLTAVMHMAVEALFWFHPVVWWMGARMIEERERACDEKVLHMQHQPKVYAESILKVCEFCVESPLTCISGVTGSDLKKRIVEIMTERMGTDLNRGKKGLLAAAALLAIVGPFGFGVVYSKQVRAQEQAQVPKKDPKDISGTWQGTLVVPNGQKLRTVVKIEKDAKSGWRGKFFSIDQGGDPIDVSSMALEGSTFKLTIKGLGLTYEGTLNAEGTTIDGRASQGNPLPLALTKVAPADEWTIPPPRPKVAPMAADADPSFEVATIKPSKPDAQGIGLNSRGREFLTRNMTMAFLIEFAYDIQEKQLVGAPDWLNKDRFDMTGVPDKEGQPTASQFKIMVRKLLTDRLQLKFHYEKKELSVYTINISKTGSKIEKSDASVQIPGMGFRPAPGGITMTIRNGTMGETAGFLQQLVFDRPVVDQTGLQGRWNIDVTFAPDDSQFHTAFRPPPITPSDNAPANFFTAIQEQAGLKVEPAKVPTDVLVIDRVEKPSEN